jgi:hypothetical protein
MRVFFWYGLVCVVFAVLSLVLTVSHYHNCASRSTLSHLPTSLLSHVVVPKKTHSNPLNSDWLVHGDWLIHGDWLVHSDWCRVTNATARKHLFLTPVKGFGNRIRAIIAAHYIALATGRELHIVWPEMDEFIQKSMVPPCVKWTTHVQVQTPKCMVLDCHVNIASCIRLFTNRTLQEIFPTSETCIHLVSYTAWELYLLDNPKTHGALVSVTQKIPVSVILNSFTAALNDTVWNAYKHTRARMSALVDSRRHIMLTVHIRTGADSYDGGMIKTLYLPQLRCAAVIQSRLAERNMSSSIFIETDSTKVKSIAAAMTALSNAVFLEKHAERKDLLFVIVLWMLLGDGQVFLGSHGSSLSRTAAQRTGTTLYQLPATPSSASNTANGSLKSLQCVVSPLESTKTHDATFLLVPTECSEIYPACPGISAVDPIMP